MKFLATALPGVVVIEPDVFRDPRGFFLETFHAIKYREGGIEGPFVQDNHSRSAHHTVRGLHAQWRRPQGKLVRVLHGEIFDVTVDIRRGSPTFGKWTSTILSGDNFRQCYVPPGFAHGFCVLSESAEVTYKVTDYYDPDGELRIRWNDPAIGIAWPATEPALSEKDGAGLLLAHVIDKLPTYKPGRD